MEKSKESYRKLGICPNFMENHLISSIHFCKSDLKIEQMNDKSAANDQTLSKANVLSICLLAMFWIAETSLLPSLQEITTGVCNLLSSSLNGLHIFTIPIPSTTAKFEISKYNNQLQYIHFYSPATQNNLHIHTFFFIMLSIHITFPRSQISHRLITRPRRMRR